MEDSGRRDIPEVRRRETVLIRVERVPLAQTEVGAVAEVGVRGSVSEGRRTGGGWVDPKGNPGHPRGGARGSHPRKM